MPIIRIRTCVVALFAAQRVPSNVGGQAIGGVRLVDGTGERTIRDTGIQIGDFESLRRLIGALLVQEHLAKYLPSRGNAMHRLFAKRVGPLMRNRHISNGLEAI